MTNGTPQLGVKAVFDDAEAIQRMAAYEKRQKRVQAALDNFADASVKANKRVSVAEEDAARTSESTSNRQGDAYKKRQQRIQAALDNFADDIKGHEQEQKRSDDALANSKDESVQAQIKSLITFKRQLVTVLFFLRFFTQAVKFAWGEMVESVETRTMIAGVTALASAYGHSLTEITNSMNEAAGSIVDDTNNIAAAQAGLLADHGRFVENYDELWQAARVAAVTAGGDVVDIFSQLVKALNDADAEMADTASGVFNVELAMLKFAIASGRTRDELSKLEKRQVILNEVQRVTNALMESGAQEALDAAQPLEDLRKEWDRFKLVLGTIVDPLTEINKAVELSTLVLINYIATINAMVTGLKGIVQGLTDVDITVASIKSSMHDAFVTTFADLTNLAFGEVRGVTGADIAEPEPTGSLAPSTIPEDADLEDELRRYEEFLKRIHGLRDRAIKEMETLELRYIQRLEELELMRQRRLEEIIIKAQRKRQDIQIKLQRALDDANRNYLRGLERLERENARRRERIWQRYWEAVRRINRKFSEDIYDAIAARDATAALKAIRARRNDLDDAAHARNLSLQNLRRDNEDQIEELRLRRERVREDALRAFQQGIEDLQRWIQQEQADLERHIAVQRAQIENWNNWRLQAIAEQFKLEYLQALAAYTGQESLLANHVARMNAIWASMLSSLNLPPIPSPPGSGTGGVTGQTTFAKGGANIFDKPTRIIVGEGPRPEFVVAVPLGGQAPAPVPPASNNVQHSFSGVMNHRVDAMVRGALQGIEGKIQAALVDTLQRIM